MTIHYSPRMRKAVKFSNKSSLSPKQLFFLSKAQISNSAFIFGNMYSLHFAHYLRLESNCKKGALSLDEEYELLHEKLISTSNYSDCSSSSDSSISPSSSKSSSPTPSSKENLEIDSINLNNDSESDSGNSSNNSSDNNDTSEECDSLELKVDIPKNGKNCSLSDCKIPNAPLLTSLDIHTRQPQSPVPHSNSIAVCIAPGLPFILQNFQKYNVAELSTFLTRHLRKLDHLCRKYNRMLVVIGFLPVFKGTFLKGAEASKINEILLGIDINLSRHVMFKNKFVKYFQISKVLKMPSMRKCGIYPTSSSYMVIGEKLQEFIFNLSME